MYHLLIGLCGEQASKISDGIGPARMYRYLNSSYKWPELYESKPYQATPCFGSYILAVFNLVMHRAASPTSCGTYDDDDSGRRQ